MKNKNGFTLIELIAVLVILAILVLIVTPLVMSIIKKARISADKRSIDAYGRSLELSIASYLMDTGVFPTDLSSLNVEYTGKEVICNIMQMKENGGIYLSECSVNGQEVKDSHAEDGWYHYGTRDLINEEYVDMYGLALKNASLAYYNTNGIVVEDYRTLTIDYKGKPVACDVTINYDGTIYMTKCKVNNVDVTSVTEDDGYYHYGKYEPYKMRYFIGDEITYNEVKFNVIANSGLEDQTVTLLKAEPLTVDEVNTYGGVGTANNRVNRYSMGSQGTAHDRNGYGAMAYYSSSSCNCLRSCVYTGCIKDYSLSDVKYVVDAWASSNFPFASEARLIQYNEIINNFEYENFDDGYGEYWKPTESTPDWLYNSNYMYWTMTSKSESNFLTWTIFENGILSSSNFGTNTVRPVITINKSLISS